MAKSRKTLGFTILFYLLLLWFVTEEKRVFSFAFKPVSNPSRRSDSTRLDRPFHSKSMPRLGISVSLFHSHYPSPACANSMQSSWGVSNLTTLLITRLWRDHSGRRR